MKAETVDRFYNVGTGMRTSIKELAEMVIELTQFRQAPRYEPAGLTFVKNRIGSPERAAAEIGFKAQVQLREGLQKLIAWRSAAGAAHRCGQEASKMCGIAGISQPGRRAGLAGHPARP